MDVNSLSHSKWNCKYHIVFAPKFRRKVAYGALRQDIANILSMLCKRKGVNIVEAEICPDHVHMLVEIPPNISVASFVGYIKGKSTLMIFERHANLKYKYGNRHFWCRGYYVDTVGKNAKKIQEYIQNQLKALNKHDDKLDRLEEICFMEKLITRKEAAEILGISIATLDAARNNGLISYVQYVQNGCVYFTSAGLQEYIAKCTHRAKPAEKNATYRKPRRAGV